MSDAQDRIARLAAEAQSRADVAGTQAARQEGRAHGLRDAAAAIATATDTRTLRDDIRDYITGLEEQANAADEVLQRLTVREYPHSVGYYESRRHTLRQVTEGLRGLLANEPGEGDDERPR